MSNGMGLSNRISGLKISPDTEPARARERLQPSLLGCSNEILCLIFGYLPKCQRIPNPISNELQYCFSGLYALCCVNRRIGDIATDLMYRDIDFSFSRLGGIYPRTMEPLLYPQNRGIKYIQSVTLQEEGPELVYLRGVSTHIPSGDHEHSMGLTLRTLFRRLSPNQLLGFWVHKPYLLSALPIRYHVPVQSSIMNLSIDYKTSSTGHAYFDIAKEWNVRKLRRLQIQNLDDISFPDAFSLIYLNAKTIEVLSLHLEQDFSRMTYKVVPKERDRGIVIYKYLKGLAQREILGLGKLTRLREFTVIDCLAIEAFADIVEKEIDPIPTLRYLGLVFQDVDVSDSLWSPVFVLNMIEKSPNITYLRLEHICTPGQTVELLGHCPHLNSLHLEFSVADGTYPSHASIVALKGLKRLWLSCFSQRRAREMEYINLPLGAEERFDPNIRAFAISSLAHMTKLEELAILVPEHHYHLIPHLANLRLLRILNWPYQASLPSNDSGLYVNAAMAKISWFQPRLHLVTSHAIAFGRVDHLHPGSYNQAGYPKSYFYEDINRAMWYQIFCFDYTQESDSLGYIVNVKEVDINSFRELFPDLKLMEAERADRPYGFTWT